MSSARRVGLSSIFTFALVLGATGVAPAVSQAAPGPGGSTVLTLAPAFNDMASNWLRGELFAAPNAVVKVPYNNFPAAANTHKGADKLNEYLHSHPGPKIVAGHSQGAQVADDWLRRYGPTSDIDPATVQFVLTGDLESKYNGCANIPGSGCVAAYGGNNFPDDTPYTVKVIARQYDYYADCPNDLSNDTAKKNRSAANSVGGKGELKSVHTNYSNIGLNDPGNKTFVEGNATYILGAPATYFLPVVTAKWTSNASKVVEDAELRPIVESAYNRPMGAPPAPPAP
ncbi:PE-PPE domain-containing protein [Mycolicibacterium baixiangningiae]|uniref:PE-PPE domain-containing protein n=1 Tax=Mycolicibacterium baixiangningiae TaxID=2761578 RepID=UPI0018D1B7D7|nr:PE-PPE domain-containing protein [Mycolicibacterium baixiangningiae]